MKDDNASNTARLIARTILLASQDSELRRLVAPQKAEISEAILEQTKGHKTFRLALGPIPRRLLLTLEKTLLPGIVAHYLVRKRKIELSVREALQKGNKALIVIAAGYDTLCLRLRDEFPQSHFVEIDHPATQAGKQSTFPDGGNFHLMPADLTQSSLSDILETSTCLDKESSAVFVLEGLTMYLTEETVQNLFREIAPYCGKLIFTFMEKDEEGEIGFRGQSPLIAAWLKARQEPFLWGTTRADLPRFLAQAGFDLSEVIDDHDLRAEILSPLGLDHLALAKGECLCIAVPSSP
ncbi:class I SAM-dependent methyltransferase [Roseibacillus persicicus]|uniref:S-adenosyl-L-methionine-dependent methyltransferase n=1 Tax=Roseibacillus persicicus TaxID=454148 RepID=A0A918WGY3_9BACT|nr:class I SAM-dependent methyltransferase [Roseibacillus persicicus]GHC50500.1 hypothetical protein GCM10007100_15800 [Roseibacillus persicicus]